MDPLAARPQSCALQDTPSQVQRVQHRIASVALRVKPEKWKRTNHVAKSCSIRDWLLCCATAWGAGQQAVAAVCGSQGGMPGSPFTVSLYTIMGFTESGAAATALIIIAGMSVGLPLLCFASTEAAAGTFTVDADASRCTSRVGLLFLSAGGE